MIYCSFMLIIYYTLLLCCGIFNIVVLQATLVGLEPLEQGRTAVASVLIKLPTGGEAKPGTGCSGLAFASTLVTIGEETDVCNE